MGFDYGKRRMGIALGNLITGKAQPLTALEHNQGIPDWMKLDKLMDEWQPSLLVIGLPLQADGQSQKMTRRAKNFSQELWGRYKLPTRMIDERYTTIEAVGRIKAARASGSRGRRTARGDVDAMAAQTILESWLSGDIQGEA